MCHATSWITYTCGDYIRRWRLHTRLCRDLFTCLTQLNKFARFASATAYNRSNPFLSLRHFVTPPSSDGGFFRRVGDATPYVEVLIRREQAHRPTSMKSCRMKSSAMMKSSLRSDEVLLCRVCSSVDCRHTRKRAQVVQGCTSAQSIV